MGYEYASCVSALMESIRMDDVSASMCVTRTQKISAKFVAYECLQMVRSCICFDVYIVQTRDMMPECS